MSDDLMSPSDPPGGHKADYDPAWYDKARRARLRPESRCENLEREVALLWEQIRKLHNLLEEHDK